MIVTAADKRNLQVAMDKDQARCMVEFLRTVSLAPEFKERLRGSVGAMDDPNLNESDVLAALMGFVSLVSNLLGDEDEPTVADPSDLAHMPTKGVQ